MMKLALTTSRGVEDIALPILAIKLDLQNKCKSKIFFLVVVTIYPVTYIK